MNSLAEHPLARYYRWQARFYDATRWSFLFGRQRLIELAAAHGQPATVLEVGCGTGRNLLALHRRFPGARLQGVDLSADMLARARRKTAGRSAIELQQQRYRQPLTTAGFDLVVFAYALSMFNPGWQQALAAAEADLAPAGRLAVVDFHTSPLTPFRRWMALNHVRMEAHLLAALQDRFQPLVQRVRPVYGGLWSYFLFIGSPRSSGRTAQAAACSASGSRLSTV